MIKLDKSKNFCIEIDELTRNNYKQFLVILEQQQQKQQQQEKGDQENKINKETVLGWIQTGAYLGYFNDLCVGGISFKQTGSRIDVIHLVVLPKYRKLGIGKKLVEKVIAFSKEFKPTVLETRIESVCVTVTFDQETCRFFETNGFVRLLNEKSLVLVYNIN